MNTPSRHGYKSFYDGPSCVSSLFRPSSLPLTLRGGSIRQERERDANFLQGNRHSRGATNPARWAHHREIRSSRMLWVNFDPILTDHPSPPSLSFILDECFVTASSIAPPRYGAAVSSINCGASILKWDLVTSSGHPPAVLARD